MVIRMEAHSRNAWRESEVPVSNINLLPEKQRTSIVKFSMVCCMLSFRDRGI